MIISTLANLDREDLIKLARRFRTKKSLGQNFLVEPLLLHSIAESLDVTTGDTVVEIGPGIGFLTKYICNTGANIIAVEIDSDAVADLLDQRLPQLEVINEDFLRFDLERVQTEFTVAGNVPYQITTPIVARLFGEIGEPKPWLSRIKKVILTVQLEVANRFCATPDTRDYSQITLLTNFFADARILEVLGPEEFYPSPNVRSAVVEFVPFKAPPINCDNYRLLRQLIKSGFGQRRKMLRNNLGFLKLTDGELMKVFQQLNLDPQVRAEKLTLQKYCQFANLINNMQKDGSAPVD